ncbi:hypothetical protein [uncultured Flavobacterium sp.]|uniref:hypothetical protein n=1 Tax=uncultured Flavobacterium sp. TaxID=165435 RepID=UPI0025F84346|nr:hypothetical protein [uncultured Flavobacterium sp.]
MKCKFAAAFIMTALLSTAGAVAQETKKDEKPESRRQEMYNKLDADGDGKISAAEAEKAPKGKLKENFAEIDTNKDSFIDREELKAFAQERKDKKKLLRKG